MAASLRAVTHEWIQPEREAAVSLIESGIERTLSPPRQRAGERRCGGSRVDDLTGDRGRGRAGPGARRRSCSPGSGKVEGRYLRSTLETARWGALPGRRQRARRDGRVGRMVTIDTIRHEGILEDQGRDPVAYFGRHGIARGACSRTRAPWRHPAASTTARASSRPDRCARRRAGRHPARGRARARPARALRRRLQPPRGRRRARRLDFTPVRRADDGFRGYLPVSRQLRAEFPLDPYMGIMGVAGDEPTSARASASARACSCRSESRREVLHRRPARRARGRVALEAPLRATFRLTVLPTGPRRDPVVAHYWVARARLDEPMRRSLGESLAYLGEELGMPRALAFAHLAQRAVCS